MVKGMRLNKQKTALALLAVTTLWGCAPTEEEKKQKEEEEKNRPSISLQSTASISEPVNGAISSPKRSVYLKHPPLTLPFNMQLNH